MPVRGLENIRPNLMSFTSLFKGSDMPTKIDGTFIGGRELFWPDALHAATNDSYRYRRELNPGLLGACPLP